MATDNKVLALLSIVRGLKRQGRKTITIETLDQVLEGFKNEDEKLSELALTQFRESAEQERSLAFYDATNRWNVAELGVITQLGLATFKSAILINGGGAAALLAFIGHTWDPRNNGTSIRLSWPLFCFAIGVLAAALASAFACLAEGAAFAEDDAKIIDKPKVVNRSKVFAWFTVISIASSFVLFTLGCTYAYIAFTT